MHAAVRTLQAERDRAAITVPRIAELAGVAPSTIYRRWGDLNQLFADVAVARLRPEGPPDTGSVRGDLTAWAAQYAEETGSTTGREFLRDMVSGGPDCQSGFRGGQYTRERLEILLSRGRDRGEFTPTTDDILDVVVAPIVYRLLFETEDLPKGFADTLIGRLYQE